MMSYSEQQCLIDVDWEYFLSFTVYTYFFLVFTCQCVNYIAIFSDIESPLRQMDFNETNLKDT